MSLDELIRDNVQIVVKYKEVPCHITGKDLKSAIREEIADQVKQAMWIHFNTEHQLPR